MRRAGVYTAAAAHFVHFMNSAGVGFLKVEPLKTLQQKRKELAPTDGHVLLLEYFEEHPPLLARPGVVTL